jgi:hypothetical protein
MEILGVAHLSSLSRLHLKYRLENRIMQIEDVRKEFNNTPIREGPCWYRYAKLKDEELS